MVNSVWFSNNDDKIRKSVTFSINKTTTIRILKVYIFFNIIKSTRKGSLIYFEEFIDRRKIIFRMSQVTEALDKIMPKYIKN